VSNEDAASWPIKAVTVAVAMFSTGGFTWSFPATGENNLKQEKLVIIGGGTTVGKIALQFA
jgi:NADPH:quinone reductase-like Zn-dependent oxidoreductase